MISLENDFNERGKPDLTSPVGEASFLPRGLNYITINRAGLIGH